MASARWLAAVVVVGVLVSSCGKEEPAEGSGPDGSGAGDGRTEDRPGAPSDDTSLDGSNAGDTPQTDADAGGAPTDARDASSDSAFDISTEPPVRDGGTLDAPSDSPLDVSSDAPTDVAADTGAAGDAPTDFAADFGAAGDAPTDFAADFGTAGDAPTDFAADFDPDAGCPTGTLLTSNRGGGFTTVPRHLVVEPSIGRMFWNAGTVNTAPMSGVPDAGPPRVLFSDPHQLMGLAVDPGTTSVYWADNLGSIGAGPWDGPEAGAVRTLLLTAQGPAEVAIYAGEIYWTNPSAGHVLKVPLTGLPDGATPTVIASGQNTPTGIFVDGSGVYFTNAGDGTVRVAPLGGVPDGGAPTTLAAGQDQPNGIAVYGGTVYWANYAANNAAAGSIRSAPVPAGSPDVGAVIDVATGLSGVSRLVADATGVYFSEYAFSLVKRVEPGSKVVTRLACSSALGLALDSTYLYWTSFGDWGVRRIAK